MFLILKNGATKKEVEVIDSLFFKKKTSFGFNAKKYKGVLNLKEDPLAIQIRLRSELERDF